MTPQRWAIVWGVFSIVCGGIAMTLALMVLL